MKKIIGLVASLTLICGICAAVLAYVNQITAEPIKATAAENERLAVLAVMPQGVEKVEPKGEVFVGKSASGEVLGYAATGVSNKGYGGDIKLMVGFEKDMKTLVCYKTLLATETPGLGMKLNAPEFIAQFVGKDSTALKVVKAPPKGNEIQAITSATITSKAVCKAIADAQKKVEEVRGS